MKWLKSHLQSLEKALETINEETWQIKIEQDGNNWVVKNRDEILLVTDNKDAVDVFLYGMGLASQVVLSYTKYWHLRSKE